MPQFVGTLRADISKLKPSLRLLAKIAEGSPQPVQRLFRDPNVVRKLFRITSETTARKREVRVTLEPSDFLLGFLAAFRARQ